MLFFKKKYKHFKTFESLSYKNTCHLNEFSHLVCINCFNIENIAFLKFLCLGIIKKVLIPEVLSSLK